jgi:hypothetical protein
MFGCRTKTVGGFCMRARASRDRTREWITPAAEQSTSVTGYPNLPVRIMASRRKSSSNLILCKQPFDNAL